MKPPRIIREEIPLDAVAAALQIAAPWPKQTRSQWWAGRLGWLGRMLPRFAGSGACDPPAAEPPGLRWVDDFIREIRPYVMVRLDDHLLIRMPNQAHKLNPAGARMLHFLLEGGSIAKLLQRHVPDDSAAHELGLFLHEVRRCISGELREDNTSAAVEVVPLGVNFSALPVLSEIALTDKCNLACVFCYAGCAARTGSAASVSDRVSVIDVPSGSVGRSGTGVSNAMANTPKRARAARLSTQQIKRILDKIRAEAQAPSVSFTGGEPTLRKDLPELVDYAAHTLGMRVNLITNGTLVSAKLAERLSAAGLASAQVSIEAPDAERHDRITQVPGSFVRACAAVHYLRATGIHVHSNTTITRANLDVLEAMPRFAREVLSSDRLSMNMVMPAGTASVTPEHAEATLVRYSEIGPIVLAVQQAALASGVEFMWYSPTPLCLFNPITAGLGNKGCSACDGLLSVDASGQVLPCSSFDQPVGDLLNQDFTEIWNNADAVALRRKQQAPEHCPECDHFAFCHGGCPLYWRHFGTAELRHTPLPSSFADGNPHHPDGRSQRGECDGHQEKTACPMQSTTAA